MTNTTQQYMPVGTRVVTRGGNRGYVVARYDIWAEVELDGMIGRSTLIATTLERTAL